MARRSSNRPRRRRARPLLVALGAAVTLSGCYYGCFGVCHRLGDSGVYVPPEMDLSIPDFARNNDDGGIP
jgi:hypothetical protein